MILSIETATDKSSVAIHDKGELVGHIELHLDKSHSGYLTVIIEQLLNNCSVNKNNIDAIAVSIGPGSYTGLRIGVSTAKGLCYALDKPLIAVNTLEIMARQVIGSYVDNGNGNILFCPMIDARRMEVYASIFNTEDICLLETKSIIIDENTFREFTEDNQIILFGNGAKKCMDILPEDRFKLIGNIYPSAKYLGHIAYEKFLKNTFEDVAYLEPFYLKAYQAKLPKKNKLFS